MPDSSGPRPSPRDFSLVLGGPLFQIFRRTRLSGDLLELLKRRILVLAGLTWLPLLVLAALDGRLFSGVKEPFLRDIATHARFLVAVPLLVAAEVIVHGRLRLVVSEFDARGLIPDDARARFDAAVASALRLRNSTLAEVLLLVLVYGFGVPFWHRHIALADVSWYAAHTPDGLKLLPSGLWYGFVSLPIAQFLLFRWYFRFLIWGRFLFQVSRLPLRVAPLHPDRTGGLGFLGETASAFVPVLAAHGVLLAGMIAARIQFLDQKLTQFGPEIGAMTAILLAVVAGPLLFFAPSLARAKRAGAREYGALGQRYVREFGEKWLAGGAKNAGELLGTADIQSLADLGNSYEIARTMRTVPVGKEMVVQLAAATLLPVAPLALTLISLPELVKKLGGLLF